MTSINRSVQQQDQEPDSARPLHLTYEVLDELHSAICEDRWRGIADFESASQLVRWLKEVSYIAQESINELEAHRGRATPELRILEKPRIAMPEEKAE